MFLSFCSKNVIFVAKTCDYGIFVAKIRKYGIFVAKIYKYALINRFQGSAGFLDSATSCAALVNITCHQQICKLCMSSAYICKLDLSSAYLRILACHCHICKHGSSLPYLQIWFFNIFVNVIRHIKHNIYHAICDHQICEHDILK